MELFGFSVHRAIRSREQRPRVTAEVKGHEHTSAATLDARGDGKFKCLLFGNGTVRGVPVCQT